MRSRFRFERDHLLYGGLAAVAFATTWLLFATLPDLYDVEPEGEAGPPPAVPTVSDRLTTATLFYVSEDGMQLVGVGVELPHSDDPATQARLIIERQVAPAPEPYLSAIPEGTRVHALYITRHGDAFVDLSSEVTEAHTGGSLDELFTVYAIVNALTMNVPSIVAVQILVDGREVDTLAGHVDLRHPLTKNLKWVAAPEEGELGARR